METESAHRILFLVTKVTSQDSDKPAHSCSLPQSLPVENANSNALNFVMQHLIGLCQNFVTVYPVIYHRK